MDAIDLERADAVGGGMAIDTWIAGLMRDGCLEPQGAPVRRPGETFD